MGRTKKTEAAEAELERLRAEVAYLRAENTLLKKTYAMMQARKKEAESRRQGR